MAFAVSAGPVGVLTVRGVAASNFQPAGNSFATMELGLAWARHVAKSLSALALRTASSFLRAASTVSNSACFTRSSGRATSMDGGWLALFPSSADIEVFRKNAAMA